MSWLKRTRQSDGRPAAAEPRFVFKENQRNGAVYETYRADDAEAAKAFLMTKRVDRELYYIVVETPRGNWGMDIEGLYLEQLLPWQLDTSAADCVGQIHSLTNAFGLSMAAGGKADNYVVEVKCGRCGHLWHDAVRYHADTLVRCPGCAARNSVDSSGVTVSKEPDGRMTVVTSAAVGLGEGWGVPAEKGAAQAVVDHSIAAAREAVAGAPPGQPHRPGRLFQLGSGLEERFFQTGELACLDEAIAAFSEAADTTPAEDTALPARLTAVGRALKARFERTGQPEDLDAAISAWRGALAAAPANASGRPGLLSQLGLALRDRFARTGRLADLDDAVTAGRDSVAAASDDLRYPTYLANLSATLRVRYEHTGRDGDLDEAVTTGRTAVSAAGRDHPEYFTCRGTLGLALQERSMARGDTDDLEEAISAFADGVAAVSPDAPNHPVYQHNLGRGLLALFQRTGRAADVDGAVAAARAAIATTPDDPKPAGYLAQLGAALVARFERTGEMENLDEGIAAYRQAVAATSPDHPDRALHSAGLGGALLTRFRRTDELGDLSEAVGAVRDAVNATSAAHPDQAGYLDTLGIALQDRFNRTGDPADLDDAIDAGRRAVAATPAEHARYPRHLSNLGSALHSRFKHAGQPTDLEDAATALRGAVAATPPDHADRHAFVFNLGSVLLERFERTDRAADLDEVIAAGRRAVADTPPDHPRLPTHLHRLSFALHARARRNTAAVDLDEAVATARAAVDGTPPDHPDRANRLVNLSSILHTQFQRTREPADLNDAVAAARDAVACTPREHPSRVNRLAVLGSTLRIRFERTGQPADLEQAIVAFRDAVNVESGPPADRMDAARLWARAAAHADRFDSAADGFAAAVRLLPQFAWHGLPRAVREERVAEWSGLAADAAACAIRAGRPERAVELLEAGRSVLWAQLFNLRTDLTDLAEREPGLADRLDRIRTALDAPLPSRAAAPNPLDWPRTEQSRVAEERMRLAREFDDLVGRIRAVPGFEYFLRPVPFERLRAAAYGGPVAIVNTSRYGCHALLVSSAGVQVVELPGLTREKVVVRANTLLGILTRATGSNRLFLDRERDRHTVLDILAWLWDTVAEPVLIRLGFTGPSATPPRIWWCPTGRLAMLPLHAAGHHPRHRTDDSVGDDTVPDRVICSYTPTLTALLRARSAPAPTGEPALLAVGMPTTPGAADLPAVPEELDRVHARHPITTRLQSPVPDGHGPEPDPRDRPTIARVLEELPRHAWVHFSCHGSQHFSDPTASALWLADGPLHVAELIHNDAGSRELAFLSACQTATGGLRAVDEAIHLAAAVQMLGYRNVIATLWSIYDSPTPDVADGVYGALTAAGTPDPARALHRAVATLRAQRPTDPLAWAPYLHTGP